MLAHLYHAHHNQEADDLSFWTDLAASSGDPVLELGCGTGRLSLPLCRRGHLVFGLDRDAGMLAVLQGQARALWGASLHVFQGDMTAFRLARRFPLILLPCNTLATLPATARADLFARVRAHLSLEGRFAASLPNPALLVDLPPSGEALVETEFQHPASGHPVQVSSAWAREGETIVFYWHYDHLLPDGRVDRQTLASRHHPASVEVLRSELEAAGLRLVSVWGDYHRAPYSLESPHLVLLARPARVAEAKKPAKSVR